MNAGTETVALSRVGEGTYEEGLLLSDACSPFTDLSLEDLRASVGTPNSTADDMAELHAACTSLDNGIMQEGAYGAILSIVTDARRLEIDRPRPDSNTTIFTPDRIALHTHMSVLEAPYIRLALEQTSEAVGNSLSTLIESGRRVQLIISIVFACVFAVVAIMTDGAIQKMLAGPLQSARALLATMPGEVVTSLPPLRMVIRALSTEVQLLGKGRDASSFQKELENIVTDSGRGGQQLTGFEKD